jgi:hypothetical protein
MTPFDILSCSWPRPVEASDARWKSVPDWDAPSMPQLPLFHQRSIGGQAFWAIDWCQEFSRGLRFHSPQRSGEMRCFQVVFRLRVHDSGKLVFWDDDGCIIRRGAKVLHEDRECHPLVRHEIPVRAGDCLEIAHWQYHGDWVWAGTVEAAESLTATADTFSRYLPRIQKALRRPNGPALKMYFGGSAPARSVLSLYSMILNGYRPSSIHVFGEYQWKEDARQLFAALLPFARIVPTSEVCEQVACLTAELAAAALAQWQVMKLSIGLLCGPTEYCFLDDDLFILDPVVDALQAFQNNDLVYAPDADYSGDYRRIWGASGHPHQLPTGNINTGLYWLRNRHKPAEIAARLLTVPASRFPAWLWEQGFMATEYAGDSALALSTQRYFYPYFDGLPGGLTGYDYGGNPCGFASIHFGGLAEKPSEDTSRMLAAQLLNRRHGRRVS